MKLRECNLGDILYVACQLRDDEWEQHCKMSGSADMDALVARCYNYAGPKWTYVDDEAEEGETRALVVGGAVPHRPGVYSSWFLASKYAWANYGAELTGMARERMFHVLDSGAHRIETVCLASRKLAQRWYKTVGLRQESTLEAYCADGSDAVMFVATRGSNVR